jgi:hypothetical protein
MAGKHYLFAWAPKSKSMRNTADTEILKLQHEELAKAKQGVPPEWLKGRSASSPSIACCMGNSEMPLLKSQSIVFQGTALGKTLGRSQWMGKGTINNWGMDKCRLVQMVCLLLLSKGWWTMF